MASVRLAKQKLRAHALAFPGAWEDHPWGENVAKVGKKVFVFFGLESDDLMIGVKLSRSLQFARTQQFVGRMGYGMDASGWVAVRFAKGAEVPMDLLLEWIDESYEAIAPKKLLQARRSVAR